MAIIYRLTSQSGKCYIGQTKTTLPKRWKQHIQACNRYTKNPTLTGSCRKLNEAISKYGIDSWQLEILEEFEFDKDHMDERETFYIQKFDTISNGYNITKGGRGRKVDNLEENHKNNISEARKKYFQSDAGIEWKKSLSNSNKGENNPMYGKTFEHSEETKKKISENSQGKNKGKIPWNKGKIGIFSENHIKKLSDKAKTRWEKGVYDTEAFRSINIGRKQTEHQKQTITKVMQKDWEVTSPTGETQIITNLRQFCRENNLDQGNLSRGKHKGWKAKRI